jgi:hypothetical protein
MTSNSRLVGCLVGLVYVFIYFLFAVWPTGAGHGTYIFFLPLWPYLLGGMFYPGIGAIGVDLGSAKARIAYIGLILLHYVGICYFYLFSDLAEPAYLVKVWRHSDIAILFPLAIFAIGEIVIWLNLIVQMALSVRTKRVNG